MKSLFAKVYFGIGSTIAINLLYFIWQPYEKCVISFPLRETWLPDIFTNIIYFFIYFGWHVMLFFSITNNRNKFFSLKTVVKILGKIFMLQIPLEFARFIIKIYVPQLRFFVQDICAAMGFFIAFLILFKMNDIHIKVITKRFVVLFLAIFLVIVGIQVIRNICFADVAYADSKYLSDSVFVYVEKQNYQFICEILSLVCEIIITSLIYITFLFLVQKSYIKEDKPSNSLDLTFKSNTIIKIVANTLLLLLVFLITASFKMMILPHSSFGLAPSLSMSLPQHQGEPDTQLHKGFVNKNVNRYVSRKKVQPVYSLSDINFGSNNMIYYQFNINYSTVENLPQELKNLVPYECILNNTKINFYTFGNELLIIKIKSGYRFIELKNIDTLKEDVIVSECIKHMIKSGVFSYFEYGCDYLKKYDKTFITPYIERYTEGRFGSKEILNVYNMDINSKYIQKIAKEFSNSEKTGDG